MVAIVSGNSLGLSLTSLGLLGERGAGALGQGRNGEGAYVNIANGNLVLRDLDDHLVGRGLDIGVVRTYNSQGQLDDDNGDNWTSGALQRVQLTGTLGAAGSTVTRTDRDGASAAYTWDSVKNQYVSTAGSGAFDTIDYDAGASQFVWTDGDSAMVERYESTGSGRILSAVDAAGNALTYTYNSAGMLESIADANGETTWFDYIGTNLTQVRTVLSGDVTVTSVRYAYDSSNRLTTVTVDLSPDDNAVSDGDVYVTNYSYDGSSKRVASVTQSDGSSLAITYVQVGAEYKIATISNGLGEVLSYNYDTANHRTTVLDPLGFATVYQYDTSGQLTQVTGPAVNGVSQSTAFSYDADGNLTQTVDGEGHATQMAYDANGNLVLQRDSAGNTVTRTYDENNQLLTETVYLTPDADGAGSGQPAQPLTTRYVYDDTHVGQLSFTVSPEGRVTEYRYDSQGQLVSSIAYADVYDLSTLATTDTPTLADTATWLAGQDKSNTTRVDFSYDSRGQLAARTAYTAADADGDGILDGSESVTHSVYDQAGRLLSTVSAIDGSTQYTYDGLGRLLTVKDALDQITSTTYDDANNKTVVTSANGLLTTSTYDGAGRLTSVMQGTAANTLAETHYAYDADGRAYLRTDPSGVRTVMLYDAAGRLVAEIDGTNRVTEYVYNENNQVTQKIVRANSADAAAVDAFLADPAAAPANQLDGLRPAADAADACAWWIYDDAGRLVRSIGSGGAVTDTFYDGASRVTSVIEYANTIAVGALGVAPTLATTAPVPDDDADRVTRNFYDDDSLLRGTLDAEGYLVELRYDAKGQLSEQISYATATSEVARAAGTLADLIPDASDDDMHSHWLHDAQGRTIAEIDAEGYLTERVYDNAGNVTQMVRYATPVASDLLDALTPETALATLRPDSTPEDHTTTVVYDLLNRVSEQTNYEGTVTQYVYDEVGHLVQTVSAFDSPDVRTLNARYDVLGRLVAELSAEGAALLTGTQTQAEIDAIWADYGLTHSYDAAGRRISTTDQNGNKTLFFYDADGRLTHTVNALGEVAEQQYNTLGQLSATVQYGTRIDTTGLTGGLVGPALENALQAVANGALDSRRSFTYDAAGALVTSTDALGNVTEFSYNTFGEKIETDQAIGDGRHLVQTQSVDRRGLVTGTVLDASGLNAITSVVYDAFGRVTRTVDANGNVRQQSFDRLGRVVATIDPLNANRSTTYDAFDRVFTQTDALGNVTTFSYDDVLRSVTVTSPEGVTVTTIHTQQGQTQEVIDGEGNSTTFSYDLNGNLVETTTALTTTSATYDRANRVLQTTDANGTEVVFTYDAANRLLTRTVDPTGLNISNSYAYDTKGQQILLTDGNGVQTLLEYDLEGRLVRQTDNAGDYWFRQFSTTYTYDALGHTLTMVTPRGLDYVYTYDTAGRRISENHGDQYTRVSRSYEYDAKSNLAASTDANGNTTLYTYDADDRLVYTVDPLGGVQHTEYDLEGRVVKTVQYAFLISTEGFEGAATAAEIEDRVFSTGADRVEQRVLDADGRLIATVDGRGGVVGFDYDENGNVIQRIAYANTVYYDPSDERYSDFRPDPDNDDQRTLFLYDQLGRLTDTVDGVGALVHQSYDGNGNVVEKIAYANTIPFDTPMTATDLAAAPIADESRDVHERYVYDHANRVTWSANGVGAVTQLVYDQNGNVTKRIEYANAISSATAPDAVVASAADRITDMVYDYAGFLRYSTDALGGVTSYEYDANHNLLVQTSYAHPVARPTATSAFSPDAMGAALQYDTNGADRIVRSAYDALDRKIFEVDPIGALTEFHYDGVGNVLWTAQYATPLDLNVLSQNQPSIPAILLLTHGSSADRVVHHAYDANGRVVYVMDETYHVTENGYDGVGNLRWTTRYAQGIPELPSVIPLIEAAIVPGPDDRTVYFNYSAAGQLTSSTDELGYTESYGYDAFGNKTLFTNKNGDRWFYEYDAASNLVLERAPTSEGNIRSAYGGDEFNEIDTRLDYDALGNLVARTEDWPTESARTTLYVYDSLGRQIRTIFPDVSIYDPASDPIYTQNGHAGYFTGDNSVDLEHERYASLQSHVFYDVFGDAVANVDVAGNVSTKAYDALGQVAFEVDALGYVTSYEHNAFGEVTSLQRRANAITVNVGFDPLTSPAPTSAEVAHAIAPSADDRIITTQYDRNGRAVEITQPSRWVNDGNGHSYYASAVTKQSYNAFGDLIQSSVLAGTTGGDVWATTTNYYDLHGQLVATVDPMGFTTTNEYDANGNILTNTEYANAGPAANPASLALPVATIGDRVTRFTYDQQDHQLTQTRVNVVYSVTSDATSTLGDLTTTFTYDRLGNRVSVTDPLGATVYTYYDALGRVAAVAGPERPNPATPGRPYIPITEYEHDKFGNVVTTLEYAAGAAYANSSGYGLNDYYSNRYSDEFGLYYTPEPGQVWVRDYDGREQALQYSSAYYGGRVTETYYDSMNRATTVIDAEGNRTYMSYDAAGHVAKTWQDPYDYRNGTTLVSYTVFEYDALGRQTAIITPGSNYALGAEGLAKLSEVDIGSDTTRMVWNSFGELVARVAYENGVSPDYHETFEYDNAGHLWRTNTGDGVEKVMLYDLQGHQTAQISSAGTLHVNAFTSAQAVDAQGNVGLRRTDNQVDLLGRTLVQTLPKRQDSIDVAGPYRPAVYQTFDRWGNVLSKSDPRSGATVTRYSYNANNQIIRQEQPNADWALSGGGPVTELFYDAAGRQVAIRDANGNVNGQTWDASGNLLQEIHADTGVVTNIYDVFGDRTKLIDAMGYVTNYRYDDLGRNTEIRYDNVGKYHADANDEMAGSVGTLSIRNRYDQAGNLVQRTDGNDASIHYEYDGRGNVVKTTDADGFSSYAVYNAQGKQTLSLDANGRVATWTYDMFGTLLDHIDIGGYNYDFTYDAANQLVTQTNTWGQGKNFSYDAAGQLVNIQDNGTGVTTSYAYDAAGQHIQERTVQNGVTYQDQNIGYDALGRMSWVSGMDGIVLVTHYDAVGNKVHVEAGYAGTIGTAQIGMNKSLWYAYNNMNQQIMVDGAVDGNVANLANIINGQGHILNYDLNGNRTMDKSWGMQVVPTYGESGGPIPDPVHDEDGNPIPVPITYVTQTGIQTRWYSYDDMNRLSSVKQSVFGLVQTGVTPGGVDEDNNPIFLPTYSVEALGQDSAITVDTRLYDGASRLVHSGPMGALDPAYVAALTGTDADLSGALRTTYAYDPAGRLVTQRVVDRALQGRDATTYFQHFSGDDIGALPSINNQGDPGASGYDAAGNLLTWRTLTVVDGDIIATANHANLDYFEGYVQAGVTTVSANNMSGNATFGTTGTHYDKNGMLDNTTDNSSNALGNRSYVYDAQGHVLNRTDNSFGMQQRQLVVNGEVLATYGMAPTGPSTAPNYQAIGDFNLGYQPVTNSYPAAATGSYAVRTGDTLQAIAQAAYGDSALWYLIADANGLGGDADLRVGQNLTIPTKVGSQHNNAGTYTPYDPTRIQGSNTPQVPTPAGNHSGGCGGIGQIIMVVVAVVVAVYTGGAALAAMGTTAATASTGALVAAGAVGGAVGSIASQAVGMAIGAQDSFSWKGVALGAIGGGVAGGLSGALPQTSSAFVNGAARGALSSVVTQGIAVATGLQPSFSWRSVAASAVSGGVGQALNSAMNYHPGDPGVKFDLGKSFVSGVASSVVGQVVRGGKVSATTLAADAFGNVLGDSIAAANGQRTQGVGPWSDKNFENGLDIQSDNAALQRQSQPYYDQIVGAFGQATGASVDRSNDVRLAAGDRFTMDLLSPSDKVPIGSDLSRRASEVARNGADLKALSAQVETERALNNMSQLAAEFATARAAGSVGDYDVGPTLATITVTAKREYDDGSYDASEAARLSNYPAPKGADTGTITNFPPTPWERTYLSPEVQHVMGNTITGRLVGGVANTLGTAWASFASRSGYNPATGKNLNLVQQRDGRIDTLINGAATVLTGGASTATRIEMQAVKSEALATGRMAELQAKWGGLSATERRVLLESKSEATWSDWLAQRDAQAKAATPKAHFTEKHGPGTTLQDQEVRATTGVAPDGSIDPTFRNSARFLSSRDMGAAMQRADSIFMLNGKVNRDYKFQMEGIIGEGYTKAPNSSWMFTTNVTAVYRNGQPYTLFPLLRSIP